MALPLAREGVAPLSIHSRGVHLSCASLLIQVGAGLDKQASDGSTLRRARRWISLSIGVRTRTHAYGTAEHSLARPTIGSRDYGASQLDSRSLYIWKLETGNWNLEIGNRKWNLEIGK